MGSASYSNFQVPNTPGLPVRAPRPAATPWNSDPSKAHRELLIQPT
jgi:hypothetical protein